jgi:hypothetical protein
MKCLRIASKRSPIPIIGGMALACIVVAMSGVAGAGQPVEKTSLRSMLDAPLLFTKRHSYLGIHIYDTYYKWGPGGGIYVIENPWEDASKHVIRPVIDPTTAETLGEGVYSDPDLSWDGKRILFCFKGEEFGSTSIYEISVDGTGLKPITDSSACKELCQGRFSNQHDVAPAYLPDGRIILTTTRPNGLVPCNNTGVDILHVMNADGSDIRPISVNNVNEFDPCVLPDGRILYGRWEYVDKTALTQQSLWTVFPDGRNETALFANNMVRPEALLDARPVPGAPYLIAASLTRHNGAPRGSVGIIDTRYTKNGAEAITNFDHPDDPTHDLGDSCEPWPLSKDVLLASGRSEGAERNAIVMMDRSGHREVIFESPDICSHSPILVKPRTLPGTLDTHLAKGQKTGSFFVQDIYQGLTGIKRGEVKWLRVIEETSRASASSGRAYNQTFLVSAALAFSVKNFLGIVPVNPDGSVHFEVPSGRAVYFQALDGDGRLVHSMRTFVQAVPGVTRSCVGCHEDRFATPSNLGARQAHQQGVLELQDESWGSGYIDYPTMVQPVFDKHCVSCHGGEKGFAAGLDLSGGWTEHFNISYENLVSRRESQMMATLIAGIDCMNGTAHWSAQVFVPRSHGSGAAPLAEIVAKGHDGYIPDLTRTERDLIMAWIDTNGLYNGTWDYTEHGCAVAEWPTTKEKLIEEMGSAGCMACHERDKTVQFENDWFNYKEPEQSRILRAPLAIGADGGGLGLCQDRSVDPRHQRIRLLVTGGYAHGVLPVETFLEQGAQPPQDNSVAEPVSLFTSTKDPHYQAMLNIIREGRDAALTTPRADMPGAQIIAGYSRQFMPPELPNPLPPLEARVIADGTVRLSWERSARTIGLVGEIHHGDSAGFTPGPGTLLMETKGFHYVDGATRKGPQHYALVLCSGSDRSAPMRRAITLFSPQTTDRITVSSKR